jgi:hypothetical protein
MRSLESIPFVSFGKDLVPGAVKMPNDLKECRRRALNCVLEAKVAKTLEESESFAKLARSWIELAEEIERTQALLSEVDAFAESDEKFEPMKRAG